MSVLLWPSELKVHVRILGYPQNHTSGFVLPRLGGHQVLSTITQLWNGDRYLFCTPTYPLRDSNPCTWFRKPTLYPPELRECVRNFHPPRLSAYRPSTYMRDTIPFIHQLIVVGDGLEPPTFGLWDQKATTATTHDVAGLSPARCISTLTMEVFVGDVERTTSDFLTSPLPSLSHERQTNFN